MIFKRFAANLRAQNWLAIGIELGIVVLGVFIGTMVANWNQSRLADEDARQMLEQMRPDLGRLISNFGHSETYYATTRRYADTALAGWRGDAGVSDHDFVIAAYQASQIYALTLDSGAWATMIGAEQIRSLDDPRLRRDLAETLSADYSAIRPANLYTAYRTNVRRVIPLTVQERIRAECGDRSDRRGDNAVLPPTCRIAFPPGELADAAARLRASPQLVGDLDHHFSVIAIALNVSRGTKANIEAMLPRLDRYVAHGGQ